MSCVTENKGEVVGAGSGAQCKRSEIANLGNGKNTNERPTGWLVL